MIFFYLHQKSVPMKIRSAYFVVPIAFFLVTMMACEKDVAVEPSPFNVFECDTPSYSATIAPIFAASCLPCHGANPPVAGYDWQQYSNVSDPAKNSEILKAIKREPGVTPMPFNMPSLPDSTIYKIECWILAGAPNN